MLDYLDLRSEDEITSPLAKAMAIMAAASITHESGFHIKPRNFSNLFSCCKFSYEK